MDNATDSYPSYAKAIHLGVALFGISAFLTGELAEDGIASTGFLLHSYLGLSLAAVMFVRISMGLSSSTSLSFKHWRPFSQQQLRSSLEDFRTLLSLKVPDRGRHQGLAGLTQAFGLLIFTWMSVTGTLLFMLGSGIESVFFEFIEELHEVGESLIPLYLLMHVGAVVLHSLSGHSIWQKMFSRKAS